MDTKPGDLYRWAVSDGVELSFNKNPSRGYFFIVRKIALNFGITVDDDLDRLEPERTCR